MAALVHRPALKRFWEEDLKIHAIMIINLWGNHIQKRRAEMSFKCNTGTDKFHCKSER